MQSKQPPKYMVFDHETTIHQAFKRKACQWHPDNFVVLRAWKVQGDPQCYWTYNKTKEQADADYLHIPEDVMLLVGFNIKFDLLWEYKTNPTLDAFFKRGGAIWCCQYAEYLIRGQHERFHMCSLDDVVEHYGGRKKIDAIKPLWESGVQTYDINEDLLLDYAVGTEDEGRNSGDVGNTELIFLGQYEKVQQLRMLQAVTTRMDGLSCTIEMERNGVRVSMQEVRRKLPLLHAELKEVNEELSSFIPDLPPELEFNWNSGVHASALVFGGAVKYKKKLRYKVDGEWARLKATERWPLFDGEPVSTSTTNMDYSSVTGLWELNGHTQDVYKSGKKKGDGKFKNVSVPGEYKEKLHDLKFEFEGYAKPNPSWITSQLDANGGPVYSLDKDTVAALEQDGHPFCQAYSRSQFLNKEIGTYYISKDAKGNLKGMLTCVDPRTHIIHHKLNHTSTKTTRLSSSDPNLQNLSRKDKSEVKKMFVSRYPGGRMLEADYSQLEVVVQGLLSNDKQLVSDLISRVDFHCKRVSQTYGITYEEAVYLCKDEDAPNHGMWKARRTGCKNFSFQRAYGAGAQAISDATGIPVEDVKAMIEAEEALYPGVVAFNSAVEVAVEKSARPFRDPVRGYRVFRRGYWQAPTGCLYSWRSWDAPAWMKEAKGIEDTFAPPELKNYPVQGTGGEIVQMILGKLWRHFMQNDRYGGQACLVNTVHDCVWVDYHPAVQAEVAADMKEIMESVPEELEARFGMHCPVPFPVDVEVGLDMYDMHSVEHFDKEQA